MLLLKCRRTNEHIFLNNHKSVFGGLLLLFESLKYGIMCRFRDVTHTFFIGIWHLSRGEKEAPPLGDPARVGRSGEREITLGVIDSNQMPGYTSESSAWLTTERVRGEIWSTGTIGEHGRWLPIHSQPCLGRTGQYCLLHIFYSDTHQRDPL